MISLKNTILYGSVVKDPNFKQGKKIGHDELIAAIDRIYDKRYPVIPNARKDSQNTTSGKSKKK